MTSVYSEKISARLQAIAHSDDLENVDATGLAVSLECGTSIRFYLSMDEQTGTIREVAFCSNGCGFMLAAADAIAEHLNGKNLTDLHGLKDQELAELIIDALDQWPPDRNHCINTVVEVVHSAFAEYRRSRVEEFTGERALICTCFGVSEERIESVIRHGSAFTVEDIGRLTNAGTGCGSCQMLIREIIDSTSVQNPP